MRAALPPQAVQGDGGLAHAHGRACERRGLRRSAWAIPVADVPQDAVVAKQYKSNKVEFEATAKYWTETYASPQKGMDESVKQLMEMGFEKAQCEAALAQCGGDVNEAMGKLLGD